MLPFLKGTAPALVPSLFYISLSSLPSHLHQTFQKSILKKKKSTPVTHRSIGVTIPLLCSLVFFIAKFLERSVCPSFPPPHSWTHSRQAFITTNPLKPLVRFNDFHDAKLGDNPSVLHLLDLSLAPDKADQSPLKNLSSINFLGSIFGFSFYLTGYSFLISLMASSHSPKISM